MSTYTRNLLQKAMMASLHGGTAAVSQEQLQQIETAQELEEVPQPATEVVNLIQATANAHTERSYVEEVREVADGLTDYRDAAEVVNAQGGVSQEGYGFMQMGLGHLLRRVGMNVPALIPSMESFDGGARSVLDMQEINGLLTTVNEGTQRLEARSAEAVCRMLDALAEALPAAQERLCHVVEIAKSRDHEPEGNVVFGDGLNVALSVDGQVPEQLVNYLQRYALLGEAITCAYSKQAFDTAMAVATLPDAMDFSSPEAFWGSIEQKIVDVEDPRNCLTEDQLAQSLPNGGRLFGDRKEIEMPEGGNPILKKLVEFSESRQVQEQDNQTEVARIEEGQPGYGRKALPLNDIRVISRSLCDLLEKVDVDALAQRSKAVRGDVINAVSTSKGRFAEASHDMKMILSDQFGAVVKYIDTAYLLSDWPILNFLSNLVFTTNAFVLYAERSLALPEGGVPDEQPAAAPEATDGAATDVDPNAAAAAGADAGTDAGAAAADATDPNAAAADGAAPTPDADGNLPPDPTNPDAPATQDGTPDPAEKSNDPAQDPNVDPAVAAAAAGEITPAAADAGVGQPKDAAGTDAAADGADALGAADATAGTPDEGTTPPADGPTPPAADEQEEEEEDENADQNASAT